MTISAEATKQQIIAALKEVDDPELRVNIYDLGLIYDIAWDPSLAHVNIEMTLTTPNCPVAAFFPTAIKDKLLQAIPAIRAVNVKLVFDPPYDPKFMSAEARLMLGLE